jgi:hypothetical protein
MDSSTASGYILTWCVTYSEPTMATISVRDDHNA